MPTYRNDSCCCDHEPTDPAFHHSVGDVQPPADIIQPDFIPVCSGLGNFLEAVEPTPSESWAA
jgi:hypothetical protein